MGLDYRSQNDSKTLDDNLSSKVLDGLGPDFRSRNVSKPWMIIYHPRFLIVWGSISVVKTTQKPWMSVFHPRFWIVWGPISVVKTSPWLQLELPDSTWLAQPSYIRRLLLWRSAPYLEFQLHCSNPSSTQPTTARLLIRV